MIILDTTVILETQQKQPDPNVISFLDQLDPTTTYTTAITVAEIMHGISILPSGRHKRELENSADTLFRQIFAGRILSFNFEAAQHHVIDAALGEHPDLAASFAERMVAGIAKSNNGAIVATHNVSQFEVMGTPVVNPWKRFHGLQAR